VSITFRASKPIGFSDIGELNKELPFMRGELNLMHDLISGCSYLVYGNNCLFIEDYNPKTKTFRNVRRTLGNGGEMVLDLIQRNLNITFQHEEDGFEDPSPNSVGELVKNIELEDPRDANS